MKTMTRIENVEVTPGGNIVVTVLGGEKVGTTDKALGEDAMLAFHDKGHDMWDMEYEQRSGKLYLLGFEPVLAPPELGGPSDEDAESASATRPAGKGAETEAVPSAPDFSLESLLKLEARVRLMEDALERHFEGWERLQ